ncbi:MAG: alpha/beta hydrolase-fold protein [Chthoniobacteraceae bacterium]
MNREYHKWHSPALQRDMELLVFGHAGPRMLVFPTRKQRFFEFEDHGMVHSLRHQLEAGTLQLICVDGIDDESLYCFDIGPEQRIARHLEYERYILEEVLPFSERLNPKSPLFAHGSSFGAYHAMTIALRHPQHFERIIAFSGRYDLTLNIGDFHSLFHGYYEDDLCELMPTHFMPLLKNQRRLRLIRKLQITVVIGEDDPFFEDNCKLSAAFTQKKIKHDFHLWCGNAHRFRYWRQMVRVYL